VRDIYVRVAQSSDRDQLVRMREALWPTASAEEHAREVTAILAGKAPVTLPLIILVAEASDGNLVVFWKLTCAPTQTAATRCAQSGMSRDGTLLKATGTAG
jgi:hypothetical protein